MTSQERIDTQYDGLNHGSESDETTLARRQMREDSMSEAEVQEEAERDEAGAYGDSRRCPRHPEVKTSSANGMFDAPCGRCEMEMEDE